MWVDITAQDLLAARGEQDKLVKALRHSEHHYKRKSTHYLKNNNSDMGTELYPLNEIQSVLCLSRNNIKVTRENSLRRPNKA